MNAEEKLEVCERRVKYWSCMAVLAACGKRSIHSIMWGIALTLFDAPSTADLKKMHAEAIEAAKKHLSSNEIETLRRIKL